MAEPDAFDPTHALDGWRVPAPAPPDLQLSSLRQAADVSPGEVDLRLATAPPEPDAFDPIHALDGWHAPEPAPVDLQIKAPPRADGSALDRAKMARLKARGYEMVDVEDVEVSEPAPSRIAYEPSVPDLAPPPAEPEPPPPVFFAEASVLEVQPPAPPAEPDLQQGIAPIHLFEDSSAAAEPPDEWAATQAPDEAEVPPQPDVVETAAIEIQASSPERVEPAVEELVPEAEEFQALAEPESQPTVVDEEPSMPAVIDAPGQDIQLAEAPAEPEPPEASLPVIADAEAPELQPAAMPTDVEVPSADESVEAAPAEVESIAAPDEPVDQAAAEVQAPMQVIVPAEEIKVPEVLPPVVDAPVLDFHTPAPPDEPDAQWLLGSIKLPTVAAPAAFEAPMLDFHLPPPPPEPDPQQVLDAIALPVVPAQATDFEAPVLDLAALTPHVEADPRLLAQWQPLAWMALARRVAGQNTEVLQAPDGLHVETHAPQWLCAVWPPQQPQAPWLGRWPELATLVEAETRDEALRALLGELPAEASLWAAELDADWRLVAELVLQQDGELRPAQAQALRELAEAERDAGLERLRDGYQLDGRVARRRA